MTITPRISKLADSLIDAVREDVQAPHERRNVFRFLRDMYRDHEMEQCAACRLNCLDCPERSSCTCSGKGM